VTVLVGRHLGQAEHGVLAAQAVVVCLLAGVHATTGLATRLRRSELLEARGHDGVELLVLAPVSHHFVGVGAHELALETVEVRRLVLAGTCVRRAVEKNKTNVIIITCIDVVASGRGKRENCMIRAASLSPKTLFKYYDAVYQMIWRSLMDILYSRKMYSLMAEM